MRAAGHEPSCDAPLDFEDPAWVVALGRAEQPTGDPLVGQGHDATVARRGIATAARRSGLRADVAVVRDRGIAKLRRQRSTLPLYLPRRNPVGRKLRFAAADDSDVNGVTSCQVLPERSVPIGDHSTESVPPLVACVVERGRLVTDGVLFHGVLTEDNLVVTDVSADYRAGHGQWTSFEQLQRFPPRLRVANGVSLLTGGGGLSNYGHWLYDVLPRLHLLRMAGFAPTDARYLLPPIDAEFKRTTLDRLGVDAAACVGVSRPLAVEGDTIAASSGHRNHGRVEPWIPEFLRDAFLRAAPQTGLRLYVNRRDTKIRRVLNEDALEAALAARGFRSISAADYGFQEKMDLYSSAEIIVAPHGSGLANIAFCSPGTHIVEIEGDDWSDPWFGDVARAVGLPYALVRAFRTVSPAWLPDIVRHLEVDVEKVMAIVDDIVS